jgi:MFS transporter, DHA1 family, tetracycline resistance protein
LSDKYGRRPLLIMSKLGTVLAYVILAFSKSYILFLVARLMDGFTGGNISVARAYVADVTKPENRAQGMAVIGIAFGTGFIIGPAMGGFLYSNAGGHFIPALVAGSFSLIAAVLTYLYLPEPERRGSTKSAVQHLTTSLKGVMSWPILSIFFLYLIYMVVFSGFETTFSLFNNALFGLSVRENSWVFVYAGVMSFIFQGGIMRFKIKRLGLASAFGLFCLSAALRGLAQAHDIKTVLVYISLLSIGIACLNSFLPALLSTKINEDSQGVVMGFYEGIGSLSRVIGPLIAFQFVIDLPRSGYFGYAVVLMFALVFLLLNRPLHKA